MSDTTTESTEQAAASPARKRPARAPVKKRSERLTLRITHKRDLQMWDDLRQRPEHADLDASEILRQALRSLHASYLVSDQLAGYEKRMAASLKAMHRHLTRLEDAQQINMAFLEVLMRTYYFHTVPVPKEAVPQATADAKRRIARFMEDVAGLLERGGAVRELTMRLSESDAGMRDEG